MTFVEPSLSENVFGAIGSGWHGIFRYYFLFIGFALFSKQIRAVVSRVPLHLAAFTFCIWLGVSLLAVHFAIPSGASLFVLSLLGVAGGIGLAKLIGGISATSLSWPPDASDLLGTHCNHCDFHVGDNSFRAHFCSDFQPVPSSSGSYGPRYSVLIGAFSPQTTGLYVPAAYLAFRTCRTTYEAEERCLAAACHWCMPSIPVDPRCSVEAHRDRLRSARDHRCLSRRPCLGPTQFVASCCPRR